MDDPKLKTSYPSPRERQKYTIDHIVVPEATQLGRKAKIVQKAIRRRINSNAALRASRKGSTKSPTNKYAPAKYN